MKGWHIYTDHWWRDPKHAVTTEATLVEVGPRKRPQGVVTNGPYNPLPSGYFQLVAADVVDPATGQPVRATGDLYSSQGTFQVGQRLRVRWSKKREAIGVYNENTAPEDEWSREPNAGTGVLGMAIQSLGPSAGPGLSSDQTAHVQQALGALGLGNVSEVQVVHAEGAGTGQQDPITELERLAELRKSGVLTDAEFDQQKRRILGEA